MLNQNQKNILLISLPIIIFIGIFFFVISPLFSKINELKTKIQKEKTSLEIYQKKGDSLFSLEKDYKKVEKDKENLYSFFIESLKIEKLFEELENLSHKVKINQEINLLNKGSISSETKINVEKISLQIKARGDFENLVKYLLLLENFPYYLNITSIKIDKLKEKELNIDLVVESYIFQ